MRALIVYESMYGNTQAIAEAVADGMALHARVDLVEVGSASSTVGPEFDMLIIGGPTHAFGLSRRSTREDAGKRADHPVVSARTGLREWIVSLGPASQGVLAAAFDTRVDKPRWLTGSAARAAAKRLRRAGWQVAARPESFFVEAVTGPLRDGEWDRARQWGVSLGRQLSAAGARRAR